MTNSKTGQIVDIVLNGEAVSVPDCRNIADLITAYDMPLDKIAVERNAEIVPKSAYASTQLCSGDKIEIVHFIGGG